MKTKETSMTDLSRLGSRERLEAIALLQAWNEHGLPVDFECDEVNIMFNENSGYVFLGNSEFQSAMLNGDKIELLHRCEWCGNEGFKEDLQIVDERCCECSHRRGEE